MLYPETPEYDQNLRTFAAGNPITEDLAYRFYQEFVEPHMAQIAAAGPKRVLSVSQSALGALLRGIRLDYNPAMRSERRRMAQGLLQQGDLVDAFNLTQDLYFEFMSRLDSVGFKDYQLSESLDPLLTNGVIELALWWLAEITATDDAFGEAMGHLLMQRVIDSANFEAAIDAQDRADPQAVMDMHTEAINMVRLAGRVDEFTEALDQAYKGIATAVEIITDSQDSTIHAAVASLMLASGRIGAIRNALEGKDSEEKEEEAAT